MDENESEVNNGLRFIAKTSVIVFIGIVLSKILGYVYRIIIARLFGPEEYGLFSLALMVLGWFSAFAALGLTEGVTRYSSVYQVNGRKDKLAYLLKFMSSMIILTTLFAAIVLFASSDFISTQIFHDIDLSFYLKIFAFLIPIGVFNHLFLGFIRSHGLVGWYSFILNILQNVVKVAFLILLIPLGSQSTALVASYFLGIFSMLLVSYSVCKYKFPDIFYKNFPKEKEKQKIRSEVISYSWPLLLYGIVVNIFFWIDSFAIGYFENPGAVGIYNAAVPIAMLMGIAPELFMAIFLPLITKEYSKKNKKVIEELSKQVTKWIFLINLPILVMIILFPGALINILFGAEYLGAENSLRVLGIGTLIFSLNTVAHNLISMTGKSKVILYNFLFASIANIILNFILVPKLGLLGAAISTTLIYAGLYVTFSIEVKRNVGIIPLRRKMLLVLVASIVPALLLVYLRSLVTINVFSLIYLSLFFVISYIVAILLTGSLDRNDILILKYFWKRIRFIKS